VVVHSPISSWGSEHWIQGIIGISIFLKYNPIDQGSLVKGGDEGCVNSGRYQYGFANKCSEYVHRPWSPSSSLPSGLTHACDASINLTSVFQHHSVERTWKGEAWDVVDRSRCAWLAWECSMHWSLTYRAVWICSNTGSGPGVRQGVSSGIIARDACSVRSGQKSDARSTKSSGMFMVLRMKFGSSPVRGLCSVGNSASQACLSVARRGFYDAKLRAIGGPMRAFRCPGDRVKTLSPGQRKSPHWES
jgi:hypothetical protein